MDAFSLTEQQLGKVRPSFAFWYIPLKSTSSDWCFNHLFLREPASVPLFPSYSSYLFRPAPTEQQLPPNPCPWPCCPLSSSFSLSWCLSSDSWHLCYAAGPSRLASVVSKIQLIHLTVFHPPVSWCVWRTGANSDLVDCVYELPQGISLLRMRVLIIKAAFKNITSSALHIVQLILQLLWFLFCMWGIRGAERSQVLLSQSTTIMSSHLSSLPSSSGVCQWFFTSHWGCEFSTQQCCKHLKGWCQSPPSLYIWCLRMTLGQINAYWVDGHETGRAHFSV